MSDEFEYYYVFYKTSKEPGWKLAILKFDKNDIEATLNEHPDWIETKVITESSFPNVYKEMFSVLLDPADMHLLTSWIYIPEYERYFFDDEIIPCPKTKAKEKKFSYRLALEYKFDFNGETSKPNEELDTEYDHDIENGKSCFSYIAFIKINDEFEIDWKFCDCQFEMFNNLFVELKENKFAFIKLSEWDYLKFLFWDCGETIRFRIQSYKCNIVEEPVDIEMPKDEFFSKVIAMLCDLQKNLDEQKLKFKRCENTVGKINYKELGYNNCKSFEKNRKWLDHDEQLQFSPRLCVGLSDLMDPDYKTLNEIIAEDRPRQWHDFFDEEECQKFIKLFGGSFFILHPNGMPAYETDEDSLTGKSACYLIEIDNLENIVKQSLKDKVNHILELKPV